MPFPTDNETRIRIVHEGLFLRSYFSHAREVITQMSVISNYVEGNSLTYVQPTFMRQTLQNKSRTTCVPVVISFSSFSPESQFIL